MTTENYFAAFNTMDALAIDGIGRTAQEAWEMVVDGIGTFFDADGEMISPDEASYFWTVSECTEALYREVEDRGGAIAWGQLPDGTLCTVEEEEQGDQK